LYHSLHAVFEGITGAREVLVPARLFGRHQVVRTVVEALEGVRWPGVIAFRRVVVHNIDDYFDVGLVQGSDHLLELVVLAAHRAGPRIPLVRREDVERHVPPGAAFLGIILKNGHQLHGGNSKVLQVRNLLDHPEVGASEVPGQCGAWTLREPPDVQFIDHRVRVVSRAAVARPVESCFAGAEEAQRRLSRVGTWSDRGGAVVHCREKDRRRIRIQQDLLGIEAMPRGGVHSRRTRHGIPHLIILSLTLARLRDKTT